MKNDPDLTFDNLIRTFRRGELLEKADTELRSLLEDIVATGKAGTLTIKLAIKRSKTGAIEIDPDVTTKRPKVPLSTGVYFVSDDGGLTRRNPDQMDIDDLPGMSR